MKGLVIGVGNADRGDDAAGPVTAEAVAAAAPQLDVMLCRGDPAELIDAFSGRRRIVIIDACASGGAPGQVQRFEAHRSPLPACFGEISTHGVDLGATIEMARALSGLPDRLIVYGIEAGSAEPGAALTPSVAEASRRLVTQILDEFSRE
ncbi:hydrogenase maturation protease [Hyphococcus luteus]|uniref:Hydrogenase maturation protease n=1 Tax=Hyphococcus luteus TaxID=2058213 RepID=A0A2S7K0E5_9PROT|nr:hydrogenase maturation protease [Marinicaulis flavus]PQA85972.1 hydrogenase maturation protease [Marinicaulis flavus]